MLLPKQADEELHCMYLTAHLQAVMTRTKCYYFGIVWLDDVAQQLGMMQSTLISMLRWQFAKSLLYSLRVGKASNVTGPLSNFFHPRPPSLSYWTNV